MKETQATKRIGRPKLISGGKTAPLNISVSEAQRAHVEKRAAERSQSMSSYIGSLIDADMTATPATPLESRVSSLENRMDAVEKRP